MKKETIIIIATVIILIIGIFINLSFASSIMSFKTIFHALLHNDHSKDTLIIRTVRLPRLLVAIMVGVSLALAGAIMQGIARNALASPQTFGINAGASLVLVAALVSFPDYNGNQSAYIGFIGAILGGVIVYTFIYGQENNQVRLALAGMTIHLLLSSVTEVLILMNENATDILYWLTGSLNGKDWDSVEVLLPWFVIGTIITIMLARHLTVISLGDDLATGLGVYKKLIYIVFGLMVIILAGSSVSVAGPIGFVGLIAPHISKRLIRGGYERHIILTALIGAVLLVYSDALSHIIAYPYESPVGIVTALIGGPFFLYLCKNGRSVQKG
ncbi:FecCD family ABC transporter permease [Mammaliicoccus sciuri]|uniref:FecCD family ABC transporter permease n=1 Tax=Mammaliicoccus sciuri TaxID=1296 RepID=UPI0004739CBF|nr:iron ABC transporter permease [Mammaliicoccus sciuri]